MSISGVATRLPTSPRPASLAGWPTCQSQSAQRQARAWHGPHRRPDSAAPALSSDTPSSWARCSIVANSSSETTARSSFILCSFRPEGEAPSHTDQVAPLLTSPRSLPIYRRQTSIGLNGTGLSERTQGGHAIKGMPHVHSATTRSRDRMSLLASAVPVAEGALRRDAIVVCLGRPPLNLH